MACRDSERHEWAEGMTNLLTSYGATKEVINETMRPLNDRIELEMSTVIGDAILACCKKNSDDFDQEVLRLKRLEAPTDADRRALGEARAARDRIVSLRERVKKVGNPENFARRSEMLDALLAEAVMPEQLGVFMESVGTRIAELKHFERYRTHLDPAVWTSRDWDAERQRAASIFSADTKHFNL
jgi:hypothetical protein